MKTIHYADFDITTTDAIAAAILEYSKALALRELSDSVHVPGVGPDGNLVGYDILIGPSSQIVVADAVISDPGIDAGEVLVELSTRTAAITSTQVDTDPTTPVEHDYDNDYLGLDD